MNIDLAKIKQDLCGHVCSEIVVSSYGREGNAFRVSLPMAGRDGDHIMAYVTPASAGWRVSDMGGTMMRLSYENDLSKLLSGSRAKLFNTILSETGLEEDDGELFTTVPLDGMARGLFTLGQGVTRIEDLNLWTQSRVGSTFWDDLNSIVSGVVGDAAIRQYSIPGLPKSESYPIDFFIPTERRPLYLFGVNNREKAMLTTIILQYLREQNQHFDSIAVFDDIDAIPAKDVHRLMHAGNDIVPSIQDHEAIRRKIADRLAA